MAQGQGLETPSDLVYGVVDEAVVFIPKYRALELKQVYDALDTAKTWGEFHAKLPRRVYEERRDNEGVYDFELFYQEQQEQEPGLEREKALAQYRKLAEDERLPLDEEEFESGLVLEDPSDWPGWPAQEMLEWVPEEVQKEFGYLRDTTLSGEYLEIAPDREGEVVAALEARGYCCVKDEPLVARASGYD
jgi:hypothetical protein